MQIEPPFGHDYNDLPLEVYCIAVRAGGLRITLALALTLSLTQVYCMTVQADVLRLLDESRIVEEEPDDGFTSAASTYRSDGASSRVDDSSARSRGLGRLSCASIAEEDAEESLKREPPLASSPAAREYPYP